MPIQVDDYNQIEDFRVSVIIPVYNAGYYLTEALKSVLTQTIKPYEIIIIDDGSTDGSAQRVAQGCPSFRYFRQDNAGAGAARNKGVELARGDFFAFLDADDLWTEDKLRRQWDAFEKDPGLDLVFGYVKQFHSPELTQNEKDQIDIPIEIIPGNHAGTMLIRKEAFLRVGLFKPSLRIGEFVDWFARAVELNLKQIMLPDVVTKRRIHKTNLGRSHRDQRSGYVHALKAALDRRRSRPQ
jgi:glycosyltransferase involved in cell wall biosynthesis